MFEFSAVVSWARDGAYFPDNTYSRVHTWTFDGGTEVPASPSPHFVPAPMSAEAAVDPEEAFVASLSSCHMLFFLSIAAKRGFIVDTYKDDAIGVMEKADDGKLSITRVTLRPTVHYSGDTRPTADQDADIHHEAHGECFIARSVKTEVLCEPVHVTLG